MAKEPTWLHTGRTQTLPSKMGVLCWGAPRATGSLDLLLRPEMVSNQVILRAASLAQATQKPTKDLGVVTWTVHLPKLG